MIRLGIGSLFLFALLSFSSSLPARQTKQLSLAEKITESDLIFVGNVVSISQSKLENHGASQFAKVKVVRIIKGKRLPIYVNFVTRGFSAEMNPACCEAKTRYLFFAKRGYPVMVSNQNGLSIEYMEPDTFASAVNGIYSTHKIQKGYVYDWNTGGAKPPGDSQVELKSVLRQIESP
jgi:hypothetical protein